jgi:hypothetical protein
MTEETTIEGAATETETEEKGTGTDQNKTVQTFTQEQVNKIVAKEKQSWKRGSDQAIADHETIVGGLRKDIEKRDELIIQQIDLLVSDLDLDEETLELVNGLDVLERFNWIMKKVNKAGKQDVPRTPKGSGERQPSAPFKRTQTV